MIDTKINTRKLSTGTMTSIASAAVANPAAPGRLTVNGSTINGASEIEFNRMKFLITDRPTEATIDRYIAEMNKKQVKDVVRVCAPTYDADKLQSAGIKVKDWSMYEDGQIPPREVLDGWLSLIREKQLEGPDSCIAVHCVAGLGRAPVLVAIALMELGMKFEEAVKLIREKRRGALNPQQFDFLEHYRAKARLARNSKSQFKAPRKQEPCSIM